MLPSFYAKRPIIVLFIIEAAIYWYSSTMEKSNSVCQTFAWATPKESLVTAVWQDDATLSCSNASLTEPAIPEFPTKLPDIRSPISSPTPSPFQHLWIVSLDIVPLLLRWLQVELNVFVRRVQIIINRSVHFLFVLGILRSLIYVQRVILYLFPLLRLLVVPRRIIVATVVGFVGIAA